MFEHFKIITLFIFILVLICRAKGKYTGLVSSVALEKERITTQSQAEIFFKTPADHKIEVETERLPVTKAAILNDNGVVSLESNNDDTSDSDVEMIQVPAVVVKKRVHEEVGKNYIGQIDGSSLNYLVLNLRVLLTLQTLETTVKRSRLC